MIAAADRVAGVEVALARDIASTLGARIDWVRAPESELMPALHDRRLDLVIGGLVDTTAWQREVALTRPYFEERRGSEKRRHVLAAAPGENAWLVRIERVLHADASRVPTFIALSHP